MLLIHHAGTIGGATASGAAFAIGASVHTETVSTLFIAVAGVIGAVVAVLSYLSGRKNDPTLALAEHAREDASRFDAHDAKLDMLIEHLITTKATPKEPTA